MLAFRVVGYVGIAMLALLIPQTGEHRFLLAFILLAVAPLLILLEMRFRTSDRRWVDPMIDLFSVVILIHLVPGVWYPAFCIGLVVSLAPSNSLHPASHFIYACYATVLLGGMSIAGWYHNVEQWWVSVLVVLVIYPSVVFYANWQVRRADVLRERAEFVRTIQRLAGNVAHDLNNALTSISGHAELLGEELQTHQQSREDVLGIMQGVERAQQLSHQLMSVSSSAQDAKQLLNLDAEITALLGLLNSAAPGNIRIELESSIQTGAVIANRAEVLNVLMNAILGTGETASHTPVRVHLSSAQEADGYWAYIRVERDNQKPLSAVDRYLIQWFGNIMRPGGLGLSHAREIMRANDGDIDIGYLPQSIQVILTLPLVPVREHAAPLRAARAQTGEVLLVDDEVQVRTVIKRMLSKMGYTVTDVADADEAVSLFQTLSRRIKFAVLDLKMPVKDGWDCLKELREIRPDLPVIVISGYDPDESKRAEFQDSITFLSKPFNKAQLEQTVTELV